jgi:surfactin synthase thioesterase subunit
MFDGDHFFIHTHRMQILTLIEELVAQAVASKHVAT